MTKSHYISIVIGIVFIAYLIIYIFLIRPKQSNWVTIYPSDNTESFRVLGHWGQDIKTKKKMYYVKIKRTAKGLEPGK